MGETKYGKYIITRGKTEIARGPWEPQLPPEEHMDLIYLDSEVLEGAFYVECSWFWPVAEISPTEVLPHTHDFDEVLALFGTNREDPHDLCAELEFWLGDEKHIITKSCIVFVPRGLQHGPIRFRRIDRPVFHFNCGTTKKYLQ